MNDMHTSCRVWWFEGFWEETRHTAPVNPYADYGEEPFRNLGMLSKKMRQREVKFTDEHGPHCLYVAQPQRGSDRDYDDLGPMRMGGILLSGRMIDLLSEFDLGATQVLELPMFEGLGEPLSPSSGVKEPDMSRPISGRWGMLHIREAKDAVIDEKCQDVGHSVEAPWLDYQMLSVSSRSSKTILALDSAIACEGADLWFDKRISMVPFISDRLRQAIEKADLRVPTMKWLKEAVLY